MDDEDGEVDPSGRGIVEEPHLAEAHNQLPAAGRCVDQPSSGSAWTLLAWTITAEAPPGLGFEWMSSRSNWPMTNRRVGGGHRVNKCAGQGFAGRHFATCWPTLEPGR